MTMHKDLNDQWRALVEDEAEYMATDITDFGQSLALARECWINAFDKAAAELDRA